MANVINILISAKDQASSVIEGVSSKFEKSVDASKKIAVGVAAVGTAAAVGLGIATTSAANFESQMGNISTITAMDAKTAFDTIGQSILEMSKRMPQSADDLGASAYDILSAGISDSAQAMKVLESSAKLATAGLSTAGEATDIMTSAINAFGLNANDSNKIADVLFKTTAYGKTTVAQMAQAFGATAPVIASAKISLEEFSAATAAMTTTGLPAAQAQNQLRQAVVSLTKPTAEMEALLKKAGLTSGTAAMEQLGLVGTMNKLKDAAKGNQTELAGAYGSVEALGAATALTGQVSGTFVKALDDMKNGSNAVDSAFEKQQKTTNNAMAMLKNNVNAIGISIGSNLLPPLASAAGFLANNLAPALEKTYNFLDQNKIVIAIVGGAILGALVPAFWAWATAAGAAAIATLTALAPFIAIGAAVAAVAYLIISNWDWISQTTINVWNTITGFIFEKINWFKNNWAEAIGFVIGFFATLPIKLPIFIFNAIASIIGILSRVDWGGVFSSIGRAFEGVMGWIWNAIQNTWKKMTSIDWGSLFSGIGKAVGNGIIGLLEGAINGALKGIPTSPSIRLPRFKRGVQNFEGGWAVVGDTNSGNGELVHLPQGSDVYSNQDTKQMLNGGFGGQTINNTFIVNNQFDVRQAAREMGYILAR